VNSRTRSGETPLMLAARTCDDEQIIQTLIDNGAELDMMVRHKLKLYKTLPELSF
jgi:ankyrin repeat protein